MKKLIQLTLVPLLLVTLGSAPAQADDEAIAAIGGFVAGIITGSIIDDHDHRSHVYIGHDRYDRNQCRPRHERTHDRGYCGRDGCRKRDCRSDHRIGHKRGHWEIKHVRVWVPGRWVVKRDRCGDRIKVWNRGHYRWEKERVWVSYNKRDGCRKGYKG